jgi:hypothetical protein
LNIANVLLWVPNVLSLITILVLIFTWRAALKQARAAEALTESTKQQIRANEASAQAAREQVEVARRQITESLRPILIFSSETLAGHGRAANEGNGVALDVWWTYGSWGGKISERFELGRRIVPPGRDLKFRFDKQKMESKGLLIVYRSLAGITSATSVSGGWLNPQLDYHPDVTEWDCKITAGYTPDRTETDDQD